MSVQGMRIVALQSACVEVFTLQGIANYYSVRLPSGKLVKDVVWYYKDPNVDCAGIAGYVAFYDEKLKSTS